MPDLAGGGQAGMTGKLRPHGGFVADEQELQIGSTRECDCGASQHRGRPAITSHRVDGDSRRVHDHPACCVRVDQASTETISRPL